MATTKPTGHTRKNAPKSSKAVTRSSTSGKAAPKDENYSATSKASAKVTNTAVRLSADDAARLDRLADEYADGDKSATIRLALLRLDEQAQRRESMREFLDEWDQELGGRDAEGESEVKRRYFS